MRLTREQLARLRHRHLGYRITLVAELTFLLLLPLAQIVPWLLSVMLIVLALVLIIFVSRYSSITKTRPLIYGLGLAALSMEVLWHLTLQVDPPLGRMLTTTHVLVWVLFLLLAIVRKVKSLIREPYVTVSVVLGAASGYLSVGLAGGVLLNALWVLDPSAFNAAALPVLPGQQSTTMASAPSLMAASFGLLTTAGTSVLAPASISGQVVANVITISGQLYVAILIAMILGRFHQRAS